MNYKFNKKDDWFYVNLQEKTNEILERFTYYGWTPQKVQTIIDGVKLGKTKPYGEEYNWASEDVEIYVNQKGVLLIDMLAQRAGKQDPKSSTLQLTHEDFLKFLENFKKFVQENS